MTTTTRNGAAERLLLIGPSPGESFIDMLDAALAAERRATVEKVRDQLSKRIFVAGELGLGFVGQKRWEAIDRVLTEVAE